MTAGRPYQGTGTIGDPLIEPHGNTSAPPLHDRVLPSEICAADQHGIYIQGGDEKAAPDGDMIALWRAVVQRAFMDASWNEDTRWQDKTHEIVWRTQARAWLLSRNNDFHEVCNLARLDPHFVHEAAVRLAGKGWHTIGTMEWMVSS